MDELAQQSKVLATEGCQEYMGRVDGGKDSALTRGGLYPRDTGKLGREARMEDQGEAIVEGLFFTIPLARCRPASQVVWEAGSETLPPHQLWDSIRKTPLGENSHQLCTFKNTAKIEGIPNAKKKSKFN